jgi:hypothetical protein
LSTLLLATDITLHLLGWNFNSHVSDEQSFKSLFQALVRPHIEYAEAVWSPFKVGDIEKIESVQRRATKQVPYIDNSNDEGIFSHIQPTCFYLHLLAMSPCI